MRENIKLGCPNCKYEAAEKGNIRAHMQSMHEGAELSCINCENGAPHNINLKTHTKSIQVRLRFNITY